MKSIKNFTLACLLFASLLVSANPIAEKPTFGKEVAQLLSQANLEPGKYTINFLLNSEGQLVVISTGNAKNEGAIKNALNYKELKDKSLNVNQIYTLPITVQKSTK